MPDSVSPPPPPRFEDTDPSDAPPPPPPFEATDPSDSPPPPPAIEATEPAAYRLTKEDLERDIHTISTKLEGIDNPIAAVREVQRNPDILTGTRPESRAAFIRSAESEMLPKMREIYGLATDEEAREKLYSDPAAMDYGRLLARGFVPQSKETFASQAAGLAQFTGNTFYEQAKKFVKEKYAIETDAGVMKKLDEMITELDATDAQRGPMGFGDRLLQGLEHAGTYGMGQAAENAATGQRDPRDTPEQAFARQARAALGNKKIAGKIDAWRDSVRAETPIDPRLEGTNSAAFIQGIQQMPAQMITSLFSGVREMSNFSQLYDEAWQQGVQKAKKEKKPVDEAALHRAAVGAALVNLPLETASDLLLFGQGKKLLPKPLADRLKRITATNPVKSFLAMTAIKALSEAGTETAQGFVTSSFVGDPTTQGWQQNFFGGLGGGVMAHATQVPGEILERRTARAILAGTHPAAVQLQAIVDDSAQPPAQRVAAAAQLAKLRTDAQLHVSGPPAAQAAAAAAPVAAAGLPATAAAVAANPAVASALDGLQPSQDYAAQQAALLAQTQAQQTTPAPPTAPPVAPAPPAPAPAPSPDPAQAPSPSFTPLDNWLRRNAPTVTPTESAPTPIAGAEPQAAPPAAEPAPAASFGTAINEIASSIEGTAKFGQKVFLSAVFAEAKKRGLVSTQEEFQQKMIDAQISGDVIMARADFHNLFTPEQAAHHQGLEIKRGSEAFHFIVPKRNAETPPAPAVQRQEAPPEEPREVDKAAPVGDDKGAFPVLSVPASEIGVRPDIMQFKRSDDLATGVNDQERLEGEWDPLKAGTLLLWQPNNPAEYQLPEGQKYIVANGHHRHEFGQRQDVPVYNAQILKESDGYSALDARRLGAEINIADGKGSIYDQARFIRDTAATRGANEAVAAARRVGARGGSAAAIALLASDSLFAAFINERISPEHAAAIALAAPNNEGAQRWGMRSALAGKPPAFAGNMAKAATAQTGGEAQTGDLFGLDDPAIAAMEAAAQRATDIQRELQEQVTAVQSAARRPEVAARMGVNVNDPAAVQKRVADLKAELRRWESWPMHPDLLARANGIDPAAPPATDTRGQDIFAGQGDDPFNLTAESAQEQRAREEREAAEKMAKEAEEARLAREEQDRQQQTMFAAPTAMRRYKVGDTYIHNGVEHTIIRDLGSHLILEQTDRPAITRTIEKGEKLSNGQVNRLVNLARLKLSEYFANVGHPQTVYPTGMPGTTMFVGVDQEGTPRIYVNTEEVGAAMAGLTEEDAGDRIFMALSEELVHVAEVRFQSQNPQATTAFLAWVSDPDAPGHSPDFLSFMRETYTGWDGLKPYQKASEAARVIVQKRWYGRITEAVRGYLSALHSYLTEFVLGLETKPDAVQAYIKGIEDVLFGRVSPLTVDNPVGTNQGETRQSTALQQAALAARVQDVFARLAEDDTQAERDLMALRDEVFGALNTGEQMEAAGARFFSSAEFERFFEAAFLANDFDAIELAVKQADAVMYVGLIKRLNKAAKLDPAMQKRADWIAAVFIGVRPADAPPPPRSQQPPPPPQAAKPPPQAAPPPPQPTMPGFPQRPPPPPPPPPPTGRHPFNMPGLVYLANLLGRIPTINQLLRGTRGRFVVAGPMVGPANVGIELNEDLFKYPAQAAKTLAHEIGHFFDFIATHVHAGQLAAKLAPLRNWSAVFGNLWAWSGQISEVQAILREEAIQLSRAWRGDFGPNDSYRNSANELYADFISALLNDPRWTFTTAPRISAAFFAGLDAKPAVREAFNLVNELLRSDTLFDVLRAERDNEARNAALAALEQTIRRNREMSSGRRVVTAFYGGFINRYGPTMRKAGGYFRSMWGRMQDFGRGYVERMELANTYAEREISLMHDQLNSGTYLILQAAGISTVDLDTMLRNRRIIHERTLTGQYLEQNPDEARDLFRWMAETAGLHHFADEVDNLPDTELYNFGARLVWEINQAGAFDTVLRAAQTRSAPEFAERGLHAFDVSGFQLNPQGFDVDSAQQELNRLEGTMGAHRWGILQQATQNYYDTMRGIVLEANRIGLFRPSTWGERIAPNLGNYVPFMVIDYFTGHVSASSVSRYGGAGAIVSPHVAGQLKMSAMLRRMQRQKQVLMTMGFYNTEGAAHGFQGEMTVHEGRLTEEERAEIEREGGAVMGFYREGVWTWAQFEDGASIKSLEQFDPSDLASLMAVGRTHALAWRMYFTTYSVAFTIWNALRTARQTFEGHGFANLRNLARSFPEARAYAESIVNGTPMTPELRRLVQNGALPPPERSLAGQMTVGDLERMILAGVVQAQVMNSDAAVQATDPIKTFLRLPLGWLLDGIGYVSGIVESLPKIATERTLTDRGIAPDQAAAFARLEGIPNPGISGKYNTGVEIALMFARVHIQGLRSMRTRLTSPVTRGGYMTRVALTHIISKSFYAAAAAGLVDRLLSKDDDDDKRGKDWEEMVKRTTPYKLETDDMYYLGWVKPSGAYALPYGHSDIPVDWTPLAIRVPHSDDGRLWSPLSHIALLNLFRSPVKPLDSTQRTIELAKSTIMPGSNPGFDLLSNAWSISQNEPPRDNYRGRPIMDPDEWKAGYMSRSWGLMKHFGKTVGFGQRTPNEDLNWFWTAVRNTPGLGRVVVLDNYVGVREQRAIELQDTRVSSAARNMQGHETEKIMLRRYQLMKKGSEDGEKQGKRTAAEEQEYVRIREWYSGYYMGTPDEPGLLYTLKAKAAGKDVDWKYARDRLDSEAKRAMQEARASRR